MIIVLFPFGFNLSILSRNKTMSVFFFFFLPFFVIKIRRKKWPSDSCGSVVRAGMPASQRSSSCGYKNNNNNSS
jgi:hypothetical protein